MLTKNQIKQLRNEIVLNSLFLSDYNNNLFIKNTTVCDFMNAYIEYLYELATDNKFNTDDIIEIFNTYDNITNLYNYYLSYEYDPLIRNDYVAYYNDSIYAGCVIYEIEYGINDYVLCASYYINKYGCMIINKLTKNKIYYDYTGNAYIKKYNHKYLLSEFIKVNK